MQAIVYDYSPDYPGCGVLADFPDGEGMFFDTFEEFTMFVADEYPDFELVPLFAEGEDEYL
ncbi:hypothetical protein MN007_005610 [Salmonella enterica subsp. enterica serovar Newport]|nr:hypothetical protein [Salmonella enterica subsp. enterica serovar Newport]